MNIVGLTLTSRRAYLLPVAETKAAGGESPNGAANSRTAYALRLFCRLGASSYGRPGGGEPKGSPVLHRSLNPRLGRPPV